MRLDRIQTWLQTVPSEVFRGLVAHLLRVRARTWYALWLAVVAVVTTSVAGYQRILARLQFYQSMAQLHASISQRRQQALTPLVTPPPASGRTTVEQQSSPPLLHTDDTDGSVPLHVPQQQQRQLEQGQGTVSTDTGTHDLDSGPTTNMLDIWQAGMHRLQYALDQLHYRLRRQCEDTSDSSDYTLILLKNKVTAVKHDIALELGQSGPDKPYAMGYYSYATSIAAQTDPCSQIRSELRTLKGIVLNPKYLP
ncbi:hypothetical protein H4R35_003904 [Dimargaris xerosporica]|nr:hypothetical protein H4R35_003904 [Dimargaris xerosporica]